MENLEPIALELGKHIEAKLPEGVKFILLLAQKENGKCATNMKEPQRSAYLRKCADYSGLQQAGGLMFSLLKLIRKILAPKR